MVIKNRKALVLYRILHTPSVVKVNRRFFNKWGAGIFRVRGNT